MALFIRQNEERSKLQERLAAELQERAIKKALIEDSDNDGVDDSEFVKDTKQTTSLAWVWVVVVTTLVVLVVWLTLLG